MYLKSIEVQGFKSFANRILFEFHNGITGIVGPNGSGKSNVADAVRWVLGEQSARTLRGVSMTDVIFSGTEERKPLSYAYVAITMDNSDHVLPVEYEEVTIARRVYRSGESEYLLNGAPCRLKDVTEMLYDTGIGKEGYSIIGQGQIDRILSGKPEDRRELFDEAAGIVKFKRRKTAAEKKLEKERDNLVRVRDILKELEGRVGPLKLQSDAARQYLTKKEALKAAELNRFLLEMEDSEKRLSELRKNEEHTGTELNESKAGMERIHREYEETEKTIAELDAAQESIREQISNAAMHKQKLESEIELLQEQIKTAERTREHYEERSLAVEKELAGKAEQFKTYETSLSKLKKELSELAEKREKSEEELSKIQREANEARETIQQGNKEIIELLNKRSEISARKERSGTLYEQTNLKKAELSARLIQKKAEGAEREEALKKSEEEEKQALQAIEEAKESLAASKKKASETGERVEAEQKALLDLNAAFQKEQSRYEALRNLSERYEGYGRSVRFLMEQKKRFPGLRGVVADLIRVEKKYEIAIETALGGNIQNIVTEDEASAKEAIRQLKKEKMGRATFLPMESVTGRDMEKQKGFLSEPGVIGFANTLVKTKKEYDGVVSYLLGRVFTVDTVDNALALARKSGYSLHIVTLEGEYLSPGGSIAGGAFKNNSNLLGRMRELEELEKRLAELKEKIGNKEKELESLREEKERVKLETAEREQTLQKAVLAENTAALNCNRLKEQYKEAALAFSKLVEERKELDQTLSGIREEQKQIEEELTASNDRETKIKKTADDLRKVYDQQTYLEEGAQRTANELRMDESGIRQKTLFAEENLKRVEGEKKNLEEEKERLVLQKKEMQEEAEKKAETIRTIHKTIKETDEEAERLKKRQAETIEKKEAVQTQHKEFFTKRNDLSDRIARLDKELYRLRAQIDKLENDREGLTNFIWEEYEITLHNAEGYRDESLGDLYTLRQSAHKLRDEIRRMGEINVNAIEEYKEVYERYTFLKTQHDDLIESEQTLLGVIKDLEEGMRRQFEQEFETLQKEFDKAFKELFGGGKATLALQEEEDILTSGILINAQPPGKKLQNMMQLSGGEKALTAIALLFAIQNMKPSPFCLLDEIEAALDDSNVGRFAKYLSKLTKYTQFIIITHRRGTMASADRLYGITMQEKGVSALVSVNLIEDKLSE